ncbi:rRNA-processing protein [Malassezia pachydermatis]|uniref:Transducin family protein wd-40 repeat family protein n=1 Tax=Malassezia pachydermatis TaxID=77020 RepID=A0A0M8MJ10_9BASI|nr:transducin family protein wd-40 repeat family protein [Malassezia pachydermatis]KOS12508.1 transducin family protein wd-40 repeat family protein [Malassezia pachydermatis]
MISSAAWVARGLAARHPTKQQLDEAELERVSKLTNMELGEAERQLAQAQAAAADDGWEDVDDEDDEGEAMEEDTAAQDPNDLSKYRLDEYDEEPSQSVAMGALSGIRGLQYFRNNDEDPYITLKNDPADEEEERQQLEVLPTDNMLFTAKTEDDVSMIEAYIYSAQDQNLYVHHDLLLPSFPLHLEWLDYAPAPVSESDSRVAGTMGNFVAVGTMDPEIEIWNMDVVEGMYPDAVLGRKDLTEDLNAPMGTGKKKRRLPKARVPNASYHVDAVLSLSWNKRVRNMLASASADTTVKIWDLSRPMVGESASALRSFSGHADKVQSVAWQVGAPGLAAGTENPGVLLSGSYDKTIRVYDTRMPDQALVARLGADVEAVRWNGWKDHTFLVSLESGVVQGFDVRTLTAEGTDAALYTLVAHDGACTTIDVSPHIPGCLLTAGTDRQVKLWSMDDEDVEKPRSINLVTARDLGIGKIFTASFSPNDPLTVAAAGSGGKLHIWDTLSNPGMRRSFGDRLRRMDTYASRHAAAVASVDLDQAESRGAGDVQVDDDAESDEDEDEAMDE